MDACMMLHPAGLPTGLDGAIGVTSAIQSIAVEYYGKEAHAAASPCTYAPVCLAHGARGWHQRP